DELDAELVDTAVPELVDLVEVVPGVDVHQRERDLRRPERLLGEPEHDDRVLAPGEEQDGAFELGGDLTEDVDRLRLERPEVGELVVHNPEQSCQVSTNVTNLVGNRPPSR